MKIFDRNHLETVAGRRLAADDIFSFSCHHGLDCFNRCCRNLNLFLYPYDVLRLRKRLGLDAGAFIDRHVDLVLREGSHFPDVLLTMADNAEKTCPFLTDRGCSVYEDRPYSCRLFPVEEGLLYDEAGREAETVYFYRPPDFCRGRHEERPLTPQQWIADQQAEAYTRLTRQWAEVKALFADDPWGAAGPYSPGAKMAFMAAYNVDAFREFVFHSTFLKRFKVKSAELKKLRASDTELMTFGWEWIKLHFQGRPSPRLRPG